MDKPDRQTLLESGAFRRFLLELVQMAGIFESTSTLADGRHLYLEGRRSVALDVLRLFDEVQPVPNPSGLPAATLIQTFRELAQSAPKEITRGGTDAYSELGDEGDAA